MKEANRENLIIFKEIEKELGSIVKNFMEKNSGVAERAELTDFIKSLILKTNITRFKTESMKEVMGEFDELSANGQSLVLDFIVYVKIRLIWYADDLKELYEKNKAIIKTVFESSIFKTDNEETDLLLNYNLSVDSFLSHPIYELSLLCSIYGKVFEYFNFEEALNNAQA